MDSRRGAEVSHLPDLRVEGADTALGRARLFDFGPRLTS